MKKLNMLLDEIKNNLGYDRIIVVGAYNERVINIKVNRNSDMKILSLEFRLEEGTMVFYENDIIDFEVSNDEKEIIIYVK